jgi:hypothetical protein
LCGRVDGRIVSFTDDSADRQMRHNIEVVIDRLKAPPARPLGRAVTPLTALGREKPLDAV